MIAQQLSVFLENKTGRLYEVTRLLAKHGINMTAFSMAETSEFGILRVVVSKPKEACKMLRENGFSATLTEVVCMSMPNQPGALSHALAIFQQEGVSIEYLYAFSVENQANVIIRTEEIERSVEVLQKHKLELVSSSQLYQF